MSELKDKIENALNESRTVILAVQILIAFEYESIFQPLFDRLPDPVQTARIWGLLFMLFALALLVAPVSYHQIVARGQDTQSLNQFSSFVIGAGLLFMSLGLGIDVFITFFHSSGPQVSAVAGLGAVVISQFFWYGLEMSERNKRRGEVQMNKTEDGQKQAFQAGLTPLKDRIKQVLTESRMVLPGMQALLGFQFVVVLTEGFEKLPTHLKWVHLGSLVLIAVSMVLLMAPAAYHRIVEGGEDSERMLRFSNRMILAAMVFLSLGITGEFYLVVEKITRSVPAALAGAVFVLLFFLGLWFGYMVYLRGKTHKSFYPLDLP